MVGALHRVVMASQRPAHRRFCRALRDVEGTQRRRLASVLRAAAAVHPAFSDRAGPEPSWERFAERVPLSSYEDHAGWIEARRTVERARGRAALRFEPTSGSTSARKWIPWPPAFRRSLDEAVSAWLTDVASRHPGVLDGRHYWSLSWRPDELRRGASDGDDLELLSPVRRVLLRPLMAAPPGIARLPTSADALGATLVHLAACPDLALLSVWSPTFFLRILEALSERRAQVAAVLESGRWEAAGMRVPWPAPRRRETAILLSRWDGRIGPELPAALWPRLALVSAWDSSTSRPYALELRRLLPHAAFQPKGLWATEGVVSIPFRGTHPIALTSHALEFRCTATGRVFPPWRLEAGQELQPILTAENGLVRYVLPDRVRVTGFLERCPCVEFRGRVRGVDLVGEKLDAALAEDVLDRVGRGLGCRPVTILAVRGRAGRPHYRVLAAPGERAPAGTQVAALAEELLLRLHHYRVARELGQLGPADAVVRHDALEEYHRRAGAPPGADGQVKVEPVVVVDAES